MAKTPPLSKNKKRLAPNEGVRLTVF